MEEDRMLSDEILLGIINAKSGGGGGGGTDDYNDLKNQPKIEGVTLKGNKTAADLGLATAAALADKVDKVQGKGLSTNDFTDAYKNAIGANTTAISGIKNGEEINSFGGVETALSDVSDDVGSLKSGLTNLDDEVNGDATVYPYADVITIPDAVPSNLADCSVKIEPVQSGSGDPSPENVRPIIGHTEVSVNRAAVNLLNLNSADVTLLKRDGTVSIVNDNALSLTSMPSASNVVNIVMPCKHNIDYVIQFESSTVAAFGIKFYESIPQTWENLSNSNITGNSGNNNYLLLCFRTNSNVVLNVSNIQVEYGTQPTTYEPYQGKTYTIALGDTIYGGTVDFDSGVMMVTHQYVTKNTSTMNNLEQYPGWTGSGIKQIVGGGIDDVVSTCVNVSNVIRANTLTVNDILFFEKNDIGLTQTELIALAIDVAFVVELATPTTIQLTPQQIQLLKGQNTLTASTGQISVTANGVAGAIGQVQEQVNELAEDVAEIKPLDYSTTEQKTGQKWIDGNDIYFKAIDIGALPNATNKDVLTNITNIRDVVKIDGIATNGTIYTGIPHGANIAQYGVEVSYDKTSNYVRVSTSEDQSSYTGVIIIYYTKTA